MLVKRGSVMISLFTSTIFCTLRSWKLKKTDFIANYNRMICNSANIVCAIHVYGRV